MTKAALEESFRNRFRKSPTHFFFCPGRANLIGEHIDYNGGMVMPFAISLGTYLAAAKNDDNVFRFASINFSETASFPVQATYTKEGTNWYNYPLGVIHELSKAGNNLPGLDFLFFGNLPIGSGLSSSASIEVLTGYALSEIAGLAVAPKELALLSKRVENDFIGLNSGIMDQFAVAMGKKDHAILLNCDTLDYEYVPFQTGNYKPVIINSNKPRKLEESKYNERFAECREALRLLQQELAIANLCDIDTATFQQHRHLITDATVGRRAFHAISENERVKKAVMAMRQGDILALGQLLAESHQSLQEDYEVSGKELDTIAAFCNSYEGCIGGRMTGAGFGGCAIALVEEKHTDRFTEELSEYYTRHTGYTAQVILSAITDGVGVLS